MKDIWAKVEELRRLKSAATACDIDTAEEQEERDGQECPFCGGEGEVTADMFLNYDGVATSVAFYGCGPEHGANEKYFRALHANAMDVIEELLLQRHDLVAACKLWDEGFVDGEQFDEFQFIKWVNRNRRAAREAIAKATGGRQ